MLKRLALLAAAAVSLSVVGGGRIEAAGYYMGIAGGRATYCYVQPTTVNKGTILKHCGSAFQEWSGPPFYSGGVRWCARYRTVGTATLYTYGLSFSATNTVSLGNVRC